MRGEDVPAAHRDELLGGVALREPERVPGGGGRLRHGVVEVRVALHGDRRHRDPVLVLHRGLHGDGAPRRGEELGVDLELEDLRVAVRAQPVLQRLAEDPRRAGALLLAVPGADCAARHGARGDHPEKGPASTRSGPFESPIAGSFWRRRLSMWGALLLRSDARFTTRRRVRGVVRGRWRQDTARRGRRWVGWRVAGGCARIPRRASSSGRRDQERHARRCPTATVGAPPRRVPVVQRAASARQRGALGRRGAAESRTALSFPIRLR